MTGSLVFPSKLCVLCESLVTTTYSTTLIQITILPNTKYCTFFIVELIDAVCRKLAKSTLVLIPLFGVHYAIFTFGEILNAQDIVDETLEVVRFYFDSLFSSFQVQN